MHNVCNFSLPAPFYHDISVSSRKVSDPGKLARIDGFEKLNPPFPVDSSENFDVT
jgi:hypothetical protein